MKSITFLGAAGEVTGSSFLVTAQNNNQLLVDFGMFQGSKAIENLNFQPLQFKPLNLQGVVLTHAHLDHCGRLPLLVRNWFSGKVYMTAPTFSLIEVILTDAAKIMQEDMDHTPLYDYDDVQKLLKMIEIVEYDSQFSIGNFQVTCKNAGHILGSSSIEVIDTGTQKKAIFSGDLGNSPEDIIKPTEYIDTADYVVMESTYGDKAHPKEDPTQILREEINQVEKTSGVLLIPAFSIERTQEVLHRIHHLKKDGKIRLDTPIFLDSPMGIHTTTIFKDFRDYYNDELRSHTDDPFDFEGLVVTEDVRDSKEIIQAMDPKVIIAGSGMLTGGRILHHAANYLSRQNTRILFVGYQAEETLGRQILQGIKHVRIYDKNVKVRAKVRELESLSSHADQPKLLVWLQHIKDVKKVFLVHGDTMQRQTFAEKIKQDLEILDVVLPNNGQNYTL